MFILKFFLTGIGKYLLLGGLVLSAVAWLRWDAITDYRDELLLDYALTRLEQLREANELKDEINALDDDALRERASEWLLGASGATTGGH